MWAYTQNGGAKIVEVIEEFIHNRDNKAVFKVGRELVKRRINISRMGYS